MEVEADCTMPAAEDSAMVGDTAISLEGAMADQTT